MNTITLSKSKMAKGDTLEIMRFAFCQDKENFISAFKEIGLPVGSEADLAELNDWHKEGLDTGNIIVNEKKENLKNFNIRDFVLFNVTLRPNKESCKINWVD